MSISVCARLRQRIPLYLEHETDPAEALEIATHLLRCRSCAIEARTGRAVEAALKQLPRPAPEKDIASGVMTRLRRLKERGASDGALKWSALSLLLGYLLLEISIPTPVWQTGLRALARLGELIDLDFLLSRVMEGISRFLPAPSTFLMELFGTGSLLRGSPSLAAAGSGPALLLFAAASSLVFCVFLVAAIYVMRSAPRIVGSLPRVF